MDGLTSDLVDAFLMSGQSQHLSAEQRRAILTRIVQHQVVPALYRNASAHTSKTTSAVEQLATLCLRGDRVAVTASVISVFHEDQNAERLCLDLLAPTARFLGQCWVDDRCTFIDVTIGVGFLEAALQAVQSSFVSRRSVAGAAAHHVLLMPVPGGQHSFGLSMLAAFFIRAGWSTRVAKVDNCQGLTSLLTFERADVIGFSMSHSDQLTTAREAIAIVRAASCRIAPIVMVGGPLLIEDPSLATGLGADGTAIDGVDAVATAFRLLHSRVGQRL